MSCSSGIVRQTVMLGNVAVVRTVEPFTDHQTGEILNPTNVFLTVEDPDGAETTYEYGVDSEVSKEADGYFRGEFTPDEAGAWKAKLWSTGIGQAAAYARITVIEL